MLFQLLPRGRDLSGSINTTLKKDHTMKTLHATNTENAYESLNPAEQHAWDAFQSSNHRGQALFHPLVLPGDTPPDCLVLLERVGRFAIRFMPGRYSLTNGQWLHHDDAGGINPVDDPLKETWQAATAVRDRIKRELNIGAYVIPVTMFPDMEPDPDILAEAQHRKRRILFGQGDEMTRLASIPDEDETYLGLDSGFIEQDVRVLSRPPSTQEPAPPVPADQAKEAEPTVSGISGDLVINGVETLNIYLTVNLDGADGEIAPLLTVRGA